MLFLNRSIWKPRFVDKSVLRFIKKINAGLVSYVFRTRSRRSSIVLELCKKRLGIYTGRSFILTRFLVDEVAVGDKVGEYAVSKYRMRFIHFFNKAQRKKKAKKKAARRALRLFLASGKKAPISGPEKFDRVGWSLSIWIWGYILFSAQMGHLINPVSLRLGYNHFWHLVVDPGFKNFLYYVELIRALITLLFHVYFSFSTFSAASVELPGTRGLVVAKAVSGVGNNSGGERCLEELDTFLRENFVNDMCESEEEMEYDPAKFSGDEFLSPEDGEVVEQQPVVEEPQKVVTLKDVKVKRFVKYFDPFLFLRLSRGLGFFHFRKGVKITRFKKRRSFVRNRLLVPFVLPAYLGDIVVKMLGYEKNVLYMSIYFMTVGYRFGLRLRRKRYKRFLKRFPILAKRYHHNLKGRRSKRVLRFGRTSRKALLALSRMRLFCRQRVRNRSVVRAGRSRLMKKGVRRRSPWPRESIRSRARKKVWVLALSRNRVTCHFRRVVRKYLRGVVGGKCFSQIVPTVIGRNIFSKLEYFPIVASSCQLRGRRGVSVGRLFRVNFRRFFRSARLSFWFFKLLNKADLLSVYLRYYCLKINSVVRRRCARGHKAFGNKFVSRSFVLNSNKVRMLFMKLLFRSIRVGRRKMMRAGFNVNSVAGRRSRTKRRTIGLLSITGNEVFCAVLKRYAVFLLKKVFILLSSIDRFNFLGGSYAYPELGSSSGRVRNFLRKPTVLPDEYPFAPIRLFTRSLSFFFRYNSLTWCSANLVLSWLKVAVRGGLKGMCRPVLNILSSSSGEILFDRTDHVCAAIRAVWLGWPTLIRSRSVSSGLLSGRGRCRRSSKFVIGRISTRRCCIFRLQVLGAGKFGSSYSRSNFRGFVYGLKRKKAQSIFNLRKRVCINVLKIARRVSMLKRQLRLGLRPFKVFKKLFRQFSRQKTDPVLGGYIKSFMLKKQLSSIRPKTGLNKKFKLDGLNRLLNFGGMADASVSRYGLNRRAVIGVLAGKGGKVRVFARIIRKRRFVVGGAVLRPFRRLRFSRYPRSRYLRGRSRGRSYMRWWLTRFDRLKIRLFLKRDIDFLRTRFYAFLSRQKFDFSRISFFRNLKYKVFSKRYGVFRCIRVFDYLYSTIRRGILRKLIVLYRYTVSFLERWSFFFSFLATSTVFKILRTFKITRVILRFGVRSVIRGAIGARIIVDYILGKFLVGFRMGLVIKYLRKSVEALKRSSIRGYKFCIAGRVNRQQVATYRWARFGKLSLNSLSVPVDYWAGALKTRWGSFGVKFWIHYRRSNRKFFRRY